MLHLALLLFCLWFEPCCYGFLPHLQPPECDNRVLELDLLYSDPRRFSLSIALDELGFFAQPLSLFTCHVIDLPSELLYLFARKFSAILCMACSWLVFFTCIFPIDTCLLAICERGLDDSSHVSPLHLPTTCIHSTFSTLACCFFDIYLPLAFVTCSCVWHAWFSDDFTHDNPLRTCIHFYTLVSACALLVSLHDLGVAESSKDSTLFRLLLLAVMLWQHASARVKGILLSLHYSCRWSASPQDSDESTGATCTFVRSIFGTSGSGRDSRNPPLPSLLWHFALAIFHDIIVNLICITCKNSLASMSCLLAACREQIGMMVPCRQFTFHISLDDIDSSLDIEQSIQATCTSSRLDFSHLSSGWDLRSPPLPSSVTIMNTQIAEEDALTWASNINSEESSPLNSTNSPHSSDDFAAACTFLTTFTPSFHHTECPDENGFFPPILDTGATHCLLPLRWMTNEQAGSCKKFIFTSRVAARFAHYFMTTSFTARLSLVL